MRGTKTTGEALALSTMVDAALLDRWRGGDRKAGQELFQRYYDCIHRFFMNKVSAGVDDLVQQTFLACVDSKDRLRDSARFRAFLFSIAYHVLCDSYRGRGRRQPPVDFEMDTYASMFPSPSAVLIQRREQRILLEALRHVPIADQAVLEMHYWEHMSTTEMAEVMGCPRETLKGRLWRARHRLEQQMARFAAEPGELHSTLTRLEDWAAQVRAASVGRRR
jgi:RNA polymerase sigma-70 factor (ECF subfamily)